MTYNIMDTIHLYPHHITDIKELKIDGQNVSSIADLENNIIYVSKRGSDENGNGSLGNPFLTIGHANDYAITNLPEWRGRILIKVEPGIYTENITQAHYRIHIQGEIAQKVESEKGVMIRNTGADEAHYPISVSHSLNLTNIDVATTDDLWEPLPGIFGMIGQSSTFTNCAFIGGHFIDQNENGNIYTLFIDCNFSGDAFHLTGVNTSGYRFIDMRNCYFEGGTIQCSSTGVPQTIKLDRCYIENNVQVNGDWDLLMQWSEMISTGKIIFDTNGYVDIFSSIIRNGIHFISDTSETKKIVNCIFKDTPVGEGDVTADVDVEFIEYTGNHQDNGVDGQVMTTNKMKTVGGGQNYYRNIHEALRSCNQDSVIDLWGDITIDTEMTLPTGYKVTLNGSKLWTITVNSANLVEVGTNQEISFVNIRAILGGKRAILNGGSAGLRFINCGQTLAEPCRVNIEINGGDISTTLFIEKTTMISDGAAVVTINSRHPWAIIDKSFLKGSLGQPAMEWTVDADSRFRGKYTTFIHGSGGTNSPLLGASANDVTISMYNSALNAAFPPADFTNNIGNANITVDPQIDY